MRTRNQGRRCPESIQSARTLVVAGLLAGAAAFGGQAYLGGAAGMAFGVPGRALGVDGNKNLYGSFGGDALHLDLHGGLRGNGGVGGEVGLEWQHGFVQTVDKPSVAKTTSQVSGLWILPSLTVQSRGATISPFARFGLAFGTSLEQVLETSTAATGRITRTIYRDGGAFGLTGGFGVEVKATPRAAVVLELQGRNVVWKPAEREFGTVADFDDSPAAGELRAITQDLSSLQLRLGVNWGI